MASESLVAGVDIGGTNLRCAVAALDDARQIIARTATPILQKTDPAQIVELIFAQINSCIERSGTLLSSIVGLGCTAPGITDAQTGVVISAVNLGNWQNVPLAGLLGERFGLPVAVENDVKAAALGERHFGAGKNCSSLVYMTVSTGVSAGIIVGGEVLRGQNHCAGEIPYLLMEPAHIGQDWGANGCLELNAGGVGIARQWAAKHGGDQTATDVFRLARAGDAKAREAIDRASNYLAQAAVALCVIVDPAILVLGGGIAVNQPELVEHISRVVRETLPFPPQVALSWLGEDAPLLGALQLAVRVSKS